MSQPHLTDNVATFIGFGRAGVAHYRSVAPAKYTQQGLFVRDDKNLAPLASVGITNAPVMVYSMPWMDFQIRECEEILDGGGKLIVDVDDYLRGIIGKTDLLGQWDEDAVNKHEEILKRATLVTCSTKWIADTLTRELGVDTMVTPNGIDMDRFNVRKFPRPKDAVAIGWSGGAGHLDAFKSIAPAINRVMDERPNTIFLSIGAPAPEVLPSSLLDQKHEARFYDAGWLPMEDHAVSMCMFHIGLAPSQPNDFYRSKSPIRVLEQGAAMVSTVAQDPTYSGLGLDIDMLPADADTDDWVTAILNLVDDRKARYARTKRVHKQIKEKYSMEVAAQAWQAAIDKALES